MNTINAVLTDIGNVVIRINETGIADALAGMCDRKTDDIANIAYDAKLRDAVQTGSWSVREAYERRFCTAIPDLSWEQFRDAWMHELGDDVSSVRRCYENLPASMPLYTLSNTNDLHMTALRKHWLFERSCGYWASNEIGLAKPDPKIFDYVL